MRKLLAIPVCLLAVLALSAPAVANDNNAGTVKVHDNESETPPQRNVPHVDCDFWVEGFNMNDDSGWLVFYGWPPTGNKSEVTPTGAPLNWTADEETSKGNHHFLAGPFELPSGHYRVEAYTGDGHPGGEGSHFAKTKTFWVECEQENPPCPVVVSVEARAVEGGNQVILTWEPVADADMYAVYRAEQGADFEMVGFTNSTGFVDATTTAGVTYEYYVTAIIDEVESEKCEIVTVTAIPEFPTLAVGALALVGAVAAYAIIRRK